MNKLKLLDLFSGIGGFSLGLESTGYFQTIAFVEKDKFCRQVLQKNFNNIPIEEDIRNVRGSNYAADVITGGFPCQPFSVAGKRKGTDDDRYLWDETIRVVAECKPRWFIGENVEGLININNGMVLRQVQTDLEDQGFQVQCLVIPASGIGAWHQRKRIWIVANSSSQRSSSQSIGINRELAKESKGKKETRDQSTLCTSSSCSDVSNSNNNGSYRSQRNETEQSCNKQEDRLSFRDDKDVPNTNGKLSNGCGSSTRNSSTKFKGMECNQSWNWNEVRSKAERCSEQDREDVQHSNNQRCEESNISKESNKQDIHSGKFDSTRTDKTWWQTQSEFCGVPNGISYELDKDRSSRIKALGNSIVPQIARQIGLSIMKAELN
jgi:DNA (cytosine-5)-methyltransferase 1